MLAGLKPMPGSIEEAYLLVTQEKLNIIEAKKTIALVHASFGSKTTQDVLSDYLETLLPGLIESKATELQDMADEMDVWSKILLIPSSS